MGSNGAAGPARVVLCWDIDGTLLTTARAGIGAWEQALADVCGRARSMADLKTAGLTDVEIATLLIDAGGVTGAPDRVERLVARYEELLPERLGDRQGQVLPGVLAFLEWNEAVGRLPCMLLTGNTAAGARAKLTHYGLARFFARGAFARPGAADRASVARDALRLARAWMGPGLEPSRMLVIGDTPHDVACGRSIGARTLGVATGVYGCEALAAAGAWRVVATLPEPEQLAALATTEVLA